MPTMNIVQAVNSALMEEMARDDRVIVLGEDVGKNGGVFRATVGLQDAYGPERCIDTPLAESGIIGTAIGMALYGLRPVAEIQFLDFIYPAFDQIVSEMAKLRYRSGGQFSVPLTVRAPYGGGVRGGHYHSQSTENYFIHTAGLKVVIPSNPYDTKGLLLASIRDPDPVIFLEPKRIYRSVSGEVPEKEYTVPIGKAAVVREGTDCSLICYGAMVPLAMETAKEAEKKGWNVEVLDLRSLLPFDLEAILATVKKTGRLVVLHEAPKIGGFGGEIVAQVAERAFDYMEAPIVRVTGLDTPVPYALEEVYMPGVPRVMTGLTRVMEYA